MAGTAEGEKLLLEARNLTVRRRTGERSITVLDRVAFGLRAGEIVDLSGPSGSGKSTLLLTLSRNLPEYEGALILNGRWAEQVDPRAWRATISYVAQKPAMAAGTVADNLLLPWRLKTRKGHEEPPSAASIEERLVSLGLADVELARDVARLSVGQAARVQLIRSLLTEPKALLLDEADAALDDESAALVGQAVAAFAVSGGAVLRVRHLRDDGRAAYKLRLESGHLEKVV